MGSPLSVDMTPFNTDKKRLTEQLEINLFDDETGPESQSIQTKGPSRSTTRLIGIGGVF
ncbi:hypothetical protein CCACVL1_15113 [Corchorus capsularis]|uniref:Uncharacterized protein n=1 Tax=Corchorus capsularis TaxID=210143 RepID=A0A1R3I3Y6_COCAP|nr:hypothetical protein CCACVL1_15113 [Corchorus capsularis]